MRKGFRVVPIFLLMGFLASTALAGEPTEAIQKTTDKIIAIVTDPALKGPAKSEEKAKLIRQAVDERFDWEEMSRRTLARHWQDRTDAQKKEFMVLFAELLEATYLDKVEGYSGEKVIYEGERSDGEYAVVAVKIVTQKETEIPVKYRMKKIKNEWRVYDISITGVSLINNYRKQFNSIITRSSFDSLMEKLEAKVKREE
ncbi:MAG: ABC transporter substrate-binding protein [Deltaproteobacteria bacterium]|nr:ABC transporter substrate-binding protein [Deltaproteobacteria bacterium]